MNSPNTWRELEVAALMGSQKAPPVRSWPDEDLARLAAQLPDDPRRLASQLGLMTLYRRAGLQPLTLPAALAAAPDSAAALPARAHAHARFVLTPDGQPYLDDWLTLVAAQGGRLPRALMPAFLRLGEANKRSRLAIAGVCGERGDWLASLNPDWAWLHGARFDLDSPDLDAYWQTAPLASRELLFERLRAADPDRARTFLAAIWKDEAANSRRLLVEKLADGLTAADLPFLDGLLDDRSKAVRDAAVELLARLPDSPLVERMQQRLAAIMALKTAIRKTLVIEPPVGVDAALERDGLDPKVKSAGGLGEKAQWLRDISAAVGLDWLERHGQVAPDTLLDLILKSDWAEALVTGLATAAIRQRHDAWLRRLLAVTHKQIALPRLQLLAALTPAAREAWLLNDVSRGKNPAEQTTLLIDWLRDATPWPWSAGFTGRALALYCALQTQEGLPYALEYRLLPLLRERLKQYGQMGVGALPVACPAEIATAWQLRAEMRAALGLG